MLYRFSATHPNCAQAQLIWQHGTFTQNSNGSLTLTPFEGDGRQMVQNGCTQQSQTLISYDQQEYMQGFYVRNDWHFGQGGIYLEMYEFDGTPKPWLWQTHNPPEMLPTQQLHKKVSPCSLAFLHTQDIVTNASGSLIVTDHRKGQRILKRLDQISTRTDIHILFDSFSFFSWHQEACLGALRIGLCITVSSL